LKSSFLNILAVFLLANSIHIDASLCMQRPFEADDEASEQERPNKRQRVDTGNNSQDPQNGDISAERATTDTAQTLNITTSTAPIWSSPYAGWVNFPDEMWQKEFVTSSTQTSNTTPSDPYVLSSFNDDYLNDVDEEYEHLDDESELSSCEDYESSDHKIDEAVWVSSSADFLTLLPETWEYEIFRFFSLYDLGRFEMVSRECKALCVSSVWLKLGRAIQDDYAPGSPFNRETIKRHLARSKLLTTNDNSHTKKLIPFSLHQMPFPPTSFINYMTKLTCSVFEYNTRINIMGVTAYFLKPFFDAYATHLMLLGDIDWIRQLKDKGVLMQRVFPTIMHTDSMEEYSVIEIWLKRGHKGAFLAHIDGIEKGSDEFKRNCKGAKEFIEQLVNEKNEHGFRLKVVGLLRGWYGYDMDSKAATEFLRQLVKEKNEWAFRKVLVLQEKRPSVTRAFIERLVNEGNEWGFEMKVEGLSLGMYGYERDPSAARKFNDQLANKGNVNAMNRQIVGMINNLYGYRYEEDTVVRLNNALVDMGDPTAIKRKIHGLLNDDAGYPVDYVSCSILMKGLLKQGNPLALEAFMLSENFDEVNSRFNNIIQRLIRGKNRLGLYFEALGMLKGIFGYVQNVEQAENNIRKYYLAL
jgi:hypothetical protein